MMLTWKSPSPRRNWKEMSQEHPPPSAFLMLWSRGEDEDHIPGSKDVWCGAWGPPRAGPPLPQSRGQPCSQRPPPLGKKQGCHCVCSQLPA